MFVDITAVCGYVVQMTLSVRVPKRDHQRLVTLNCIFFLEAVWKEATLCLLSSMFRLLSSIFHLPSSIFQNNAQVSIRTSPHHHCSRLPFLCGMVIRNRVARTRGLQSIFDTYASPQQNKKYMAIISEADNCDNRPSLWHNMIKHRGKSTELHMNMDSFYMFISSTFF